MRFITCLIETRAVNMSGLAPIFDEPISKNSRTSNISVACASKLASKDDIYTN